MTKEDMLSQEYGKVFASPEYKDSVNRTMNQKYILPAMDSWAKIQSIAFSDWVQENEYFIPEGFSSYVKRTGQETGFRNNQFINPEFLYDMFLTHQSQQK